MLGMQEFSVRVVVPGQLCHPVSLLCQPANGQGTDAWTEGTCPRPAQVEQTSHGLRATAAGSSRVTVCTDSVLHVVATAEPSAPRRRAHGCSMLGNPPGAPFTFTQDANEAA